jgi:hypothetical protein
MKTTQIVLKRLLVGCLLACCLTATLTAQTFYLRSHNGLPYPADPYGGTLPIVTLDASKQIFQIQDTLADYAALGKLNSTNAPAATSQSASLLDPSGFYLNIAMDDDNQTKVVYFDTSPGSLYNVESSTNLIDWIVERTFVATGTNYNFWATESDKKFYRAAAPDDRLQFPNWDDYVEAFAYFNVYTTIHGTYHLELYGDGTLLYQVTANVPTNGFFGVYDSSYDPSQWPNVGDYAVEDWELRITVTPSVIPHTPKNGPAQATMKKRQRHSTHPRYGLTVEMPLFHSPTIQDEVDMSMVGYLAASGYNVANQTTLTGAYLDPMTVQFFNVPKLDDSNAWTWLKMAVTNVAYTDLHYFGHGARQGIGERLSDPTMSIPLSTFQITNRLKQPFRYAAMDGCQTASGDHFWQSSKLLAALCGFDSKVTMLQASAAGKWPRFAWGWETKKLINFADGYHLQYGHFQFLGDFYSKLSHRDANGFLDNTFDTAIFFGQHPMGAGSDPNTIDNADGYFLDYLGCGDARWDE